MNIDISKIEGYAEMTAEQKVAALEAYNFETENIDLEAEKLRKALSKANSEAAEYKKQLRSKLTEEELANAERQAKQQELEEKYNALLKEQKLSAYAAKYREQGYDEKLAAETAMALYDGDTDKVFENSQKFKASLEQSIRANLTKSTPKPANGNEGSILRTKDDILKIKDAIERQAAIAENIELFEGE